MKIKTYWEEYKNYYTEKQLYKMGYKPYDGYDGVLLWTNPYCQHFSRYYDIDKCLLVDRKKWEKYCLNQNLKVRNEKR